MLAVACRLAASSGSMRDAIKVASAAVDAPVNVDLRVEELDHTVRTEDRYDVVYARFVLSHLADAARWVDALAQLVDPGGALVLEDVRIDGSFCAPTSEALDRSKAIYCATVRANGGDPNVGPHLPRFLAAAGLCDVHVTVAQPAAMTGATKRIWPLTMERHPGGGDGRRCIDAAAIDAVITDLIEFTERADSVIATPQVIQTWARAGCRAPAGQDPASMSGSAQRCSSAIVGSYGWSAVAPYWRAMAIRSRSSGSMKWSWSSSPASSWTQLILPVNRLVWAV